MSLCDKIVRGVESAQLFNAGVETTHMGTLKAGLSPQNQRVLRLLDPTRPDGTIAFDDNCVPSVEFEYLDLDVDGAIKTSPTCTASELTWDFANQVVKIDKYREFGVKVSNCTFNALCSEIDQMHRGQVLSGGRSVSSGVPGIYRNTINSKLALHVKKILEDANLYAAEQVVNAIGNNPMYGTDTAQEMQLFANTEERGQLIHLKDELGRLRRVTGYTGNWIVLTANQDLLTWFERVCNVGCCSSAGIDYSRVGTSGFEVYWDPVLVDELGDDEFIIMTSESYVFLTVDKWRNLRLSTGGNKIDNVLHSYLNLAEPSVRYLDGTCISEQPNPITTFDLRIIENACADNGSYNPSMTFIPSLQFNTWTRPANADGSTGIFRYKVVKTYTPVTPPVTTFTVSFDSNGGTSVGPISGVTSGQKVTAPTPPIKTGFVFDGWFKDVALTDDWVFGTDTVTANITLYAKWVAA